MSREIELPPLKTPSEVQVSPTGLPIVPPKVVPWIALLVGLAGVGTQMLPEHTVGHKVAVGIVAVGALLGIVSPGLRKR